MLLASNDTGICQYQMALGLTAAFDRTLTTAESNMAKQHESCDLLPVLVIFLAQGRRPDCLQAVK